MVKRTLFFAFFLAALMLASGCVQDPVASANAACGNLPDKEKKLDCYLNFAEEKKEPLICEKIPVELLKDIFDKDYCYEKVAVAKQDVSVCDKISRAQLSLTEDACYRGFCNQRARAAPTITSCYYQIAVMEGDSSICGIFYDKYQNSTAELTTIGDCYSIIASKKRDPAICAQIKHNEVKDYCYYELAEFLNDSSLCEKIPDNATANSFFKGYTKDHCYDEIK
ncbi:Uncharacterised protein [Candidatus Gugararchaeum adminiculabundum]|nr:Uncharacterised protein [Candidatus Gugararchaeum adminiculabundum]